MLTDQSGDYHMSSVALSALKVVGLVAMATSLSACIGGGGGGGGGSKTPTPTLLSNNTLRVGGFTRVLNGKNQYATVNQATGSLVVEEVPAAGQLPQRIRVTEGATGGTFDAVAGQIGVADTFGIGTSTKYSGASSNGETTSVTQTKVANHDKFFFFDVVRTGAVGAEGYQAQVNSIGTQGSLTQTAVASSTSTKSTINPTTAFTNGVATFKGRGTIEGRQHTTQGGILTEASRYGGSGQLTMTVNSATGAVSGDIANLALLNSNGYSSFADINGGKVVLNNTTLDGAKFNIGSISLKNNTGGDVAAFTAANSGYAGGIYGPNADNVAGTYSGVAPVNGTPNQVLWLEGMFYGDRQP
jgi:hypothetical protein